MFTVGGVDVAVVGITNPEAPTLVFPGSFGTIEPVQPYAAADKARAAAKRAGAELVVAIIHAGVRGFDPVTGAPFGELIDFANNVGGFDVIFGGRSCRVRMGDSPRYPVSASCTTSGTRDVHVVRGHRLPDGAIADTGRNPGRHSSSARVSSVMRQWARHRGAARG